MYISRHYYNDLLAILKQSDILSNCKEESKHCGIRKNRVVLHLATCISQRHPNNYMWALYSCKLAMNFAINWMSLSYRKEAKKKKQKKNKHVYVWFDHNSALLFWTDKYLLFKDD